MHREILRVAFQGEPGAYSEGALVEHFGENVASVPCSSFERMFQTVADGRADFAMVPIENSLAGSIHRNFDLLLRFDLHIVAEHYHRVKHNLLAVEGATVESIQRVESHPQALAQCERFLSVNNIQPVAGYDTAGCAKHVSELGDKSVGAIASARAAKVYDLNVVQSGIEDLEHNYTRFLVLAPAWKRHVPDPAGQHKTSIVFALRNVPGALFKALSVFALRDIDLSKIESRPHKDVKWSYLFYLDILAAHSDEAVQNALRHLGEISTMIRVLGTYASAQKDDEDE